MKKIVLVLVFTMVILLTFAGLEAEAQKGKTESVTVSSTEEFLRAIAPNTTIYIDLPEEEAILLSGKYEDSLSDYCSFEYAFDGVQLVIKDLSGLSIIGPEHVQARFLSPYSYANVLQFENCRDITLKWLNCGHEVEGYCTGGVLLFDNCEAVQISNCDLWGCGVEGINIIESSGIKCSYTTIRDCSYSIMSVYNSEDITFEYCLMHDNREFDQMTFTGSKNVVFENCVIWNNLADSYYSSNLVRNLQSDVTFSKCAIFNNNVAALTDDTKNTRFDNCIMFNNVRQSWDY
ncbi:MAG: right-handed parallel beta-helix repeat-containing protein [Candidatus Cloacimonadaceae bacterium]|nr:right-handed parallel beta-helix repeat-containing protein [Candidatus Cloacimonadaceae bacterium]